MYFREHVSTRQARCQTSQLHATGGKVRRLPLLLAQRGQHRRAACRSARGPFRASRASADSIITGNPSTPVGRGSASDDVPRRAARRAAPAGPVQDRARDHRARRAGRSAPTTPKSSISALTTTSASRTIRRSAKRRTAPSIATATAWRPCASSAARRPCTSSSRRRCRDFLGTEDTILYSSCWDANGGLFETVLGRAGRHHLRRAQSRQHHRRHPALQGAPPALREPQSGGARAAPEGHAGLPHAAHRHRRRVLDGRQHRAAARDLRSRRQVRRAGHGRRLARHRFHGRRRPRHARALRRRGAHRLPHRHLRQGARRRQRRLHQRQGERHRLAAPALASLPVLEQHSAGGRRGDAARARPGREHAATCARRCSRTRANSAPACRPPASDCCPASTPSFR